MTATQMEPENGLGRKYCRGCGHRLKEEDGPVWRLDFRCLPCRLRAAFALHGKDYHATI